MEALRQNNMEGYLALIGQVSSTAAPPQYLLPGQTSKQGCLQAKDARLEALLRKTDACLHSLAQRLGCQAPGSADAAAGSVGAAWLTQQPGIAKASFAEMCAAASWDEQSMSLLQFQGCTQTTVLLSQVQQKAWLPAVLAGMRWLFTRVQRCRSQPHCRGPCTPISCRRASCLLPVFHLVQHWQG